MIESNKIMEVTDDRGKLNLLLGFEIVNSNF